MCCSKRLRMCLSYSTGKMKSQSLGISPSICYHGGWEERSLGLQWAELRCQLAVQFRNLETCSALLPSQSSSKSTRMAGTILQTALRLEFHIISNVTKSYLLLSHPQPFPHVKLTLAKSLYRNRQWAGASLEQDTAIWRLDGFW